MRHVLGPDMKIASALLAGLLFGLGLIVSGMADPAKVLGFLDLAGAWDPSLAFVMAGAVLAASLGYAWLRRRPRAGRRAAALAAARARGCSAGRRQPGVRRGLGLAGFCPGPALVNAAAGLSQALIFVAAMVAGMALFSALEYLKHRQ